MLPATDNATVYASSEPLYSRFLIPDRWVTSALEDWERGGVAVGDASLGLDVKNWKLWVDELDVYAQAEGGVPEVLFSDGGISEASLAFDQAMRYAVAYVKHGEIHLRWYDTAVAQHVISRFPVGRCPRLGVDEKRTAYVTNSDIILGYIKPGVKYDSLCFRAQRDRFEIEYVIREELFPGSVLRNIGMNVNYRFQFELAISVEAG